MSTPSRASLAAGVALAVALGSAAACGGAKTGSRSGLGSRDAVIRIDGAVPTASVSVNGRELGTVETLRRGIALSPGQHRLEVTHPDFHAYYALLELGAKERRVIVVELAERLP